METRVKHRTFRVRRVARTPSTQAIVLRAALAGAADGYCVVAAEQTAGHGRHGRPWFAPPGTALLTSVLVRLHRVLLPGLPFAAGLAVLDCLRATADVDARLKWPNDVVVGGDKLAGLLVEATAADADGTLAAVVGLGLNHAVDAFPPGIRAASLHRLTAAPPPLDALLHGWLTALDQRLVTLERDGVPATVAAWRSVAVGLGTRVTATTGSETITGVAQDVADDGVLLLRTDDGALRRLAAAEVTLAPGPVSRR